MAAIHFIAHALKCLIKQESSMIKAKSQLLVAMRDMYTPIYAWEHTEDEVRQWFSEAGHTDIRRQSVWKKTPLWIGSPNLSMRGQKSITTGT